MNVLPTLSPSHRIISKCLPILTILLPATALAHEGESSGPWIDFSQYRFEGLSTMLNVAWRRVALIFAKTFIGAPVGFV